MTSSVPSIAATESINQFDLSGQYAAIGAEVRAAIERVLASQQLVLGQEGAALEKELSAFCSVAHGVGVASGTDALILALRACNVYAGDEVLIPTLTFVATGSAVSALGAKPVFADVDPETLNLDPAKVEQRLRTSPKGMHAVMPVHLYGQCADMDAFSRIAAEFNVHVVEDAAQAVGATWNGKRAGSLSLAAAFSFYPTKNLSAFGDAGAVTTNDARLAERMKSLRNHGGKQRYYHDEVGANSRLDSIQAAVLRVKMPHLAKWNEARRERARTYGRLLSSAGLTKTGADSTAPVVLLKTLPGAHHIYHQYVIRVRDRDKLRTFLSERGVGSEIYYPIPLHLQKCFAYLGYAPGDLPEAERAALDVLALPIFPELEEDEQRHVVESIAAFYS